MYKPLQKKDSSWTPTSVQKKGKGKPGTFTVQTFPDKSQNRQELPKQPRLVAAGIIENMTRQLLFNRLLAKVVFCHVIAIP